MSDARDAKAEFGDQLLDNDDVVSVGIALDDDGNEVLHIGTLRGKASSLALPQDLDTADVQVVEVGEITPEVAVAEAEPQINRRQRKRPVPGSYSYGHVDISAGTFGVLGKDSDGTPQAITNNHVAANVNKADPGDAILQPGPADGGTGGDQAATLTDYIPVEDGVDVDLAWCETDAEHLSEIAGIGVSGGQPRRPQIGEKVIKAGRTTNVTSGTVQIIEVDVTVNYPTGKIKLTDQFMTTDMSAGGDSGSWAMFDDDDNTPAGLLFAGSPTATVFNYADNVLSQSGLEIVTDGGNGGGDDKPTAEVTIKLTPKGNGGDETVGHLEVTVRNEQNDDPIASAAVQISGPTQDTVHTNTDGLATFRTIPIGSYAIQVSKQGFETKQKTIDKSAWGQ